MVTRCPWGTFDPLLREYHDREWGVPVHDDARLFEFLTLEGHQAGLNWLVILKKRGNYRKAFGGFNPKKVAGYDLAKVRRLLSDPGIVRNRLKIKSTINNARKFLEVQREFGTFDKYVWHFTNGGPIKHKFRRLSQLPNTTKQSDALSMDLKRRGFTFVGSTICYSFMQAVGMVNDHITTCFRYRQVWQRRR